MAYIEKYFITFCNPLNQACRVSILEDDFAGVATELVGQEDPFIVTYDNSDDFKFKAIIESTAEINLVFDDDVLSLSELWTSNERTFKVNYTISGNLEWTGFIIPDGFGYNLKGGMYDATLVARDGLSTLEGILFKTENNEFYGVQDFGYNDGADFPFILILTEILRKLDLGIDLWTLVDYYEQTMVLLNTDTRDSDPLAISYASVKTYINDTDRKDIAYFEDINEAWDCKKIIENICNIWGSRLYQEGGVWRFKSIHIDSAIGGYIPPVDTFVGANPIQEGAAWKYDVFYSETIEFVLNADYDVFSAFSTVSLNDILYKVEFLTVTADAGFYLIKGKNKVVQVNASGVVINITDYQYAVTNYYWKKYNNTAGYLGRELAKEELTIPCSNKNIFLKDNDAAVRMDKVFKQFRVNYDYTFIREGDNPINLIKNGNFTQNYDQYGELEAPPNWERWRSLRVLDRVVTNPPPGALYPRLRVDALTGQDIIDTNGETKALTWSHNYNDTEPPQTTAKSIKRGALIQRNLDFTTKVQLMTFSVKVHFKYYDSGNIIRPVFKLILSPSSNPKEAYVLENVVNDDHQFSFNRYEIAEGSQDDLATFFYLDPVLHNCKEYTEATKSIKKWYTFNVKIAVPSVIGTAVFFNHGFCSTRKSSLSDKYGYFPVKFVEGEKTVPKNLMHYEAKNINELYFTGFELSYIPDPDEEVPKTDYIYANGNVNYTFQEDPIRIYNGDTTDPEIVSGIKVLTNPTDRNKWDTFNNAFGKTDIGMVLCKSVMQQYYMPNRLMDCDFKADSYKYGDIILFEHIPDIKFIMMRGSFNSKRGYWEGCTLAQISADYVAPGGIINGTSLLPQWQLTGNTRCVKVDGENTGISEFETLDVNSNSDSFGDYRWQSSGEDLISCPIGEPSKYFWGTDIDYYDVANFTDYTVLLDELGEVSVSYDNTGGKYIYFLHLSSLGSVTRISNEFQSQIISSYTYLDDVIINGYLYRVLRQDFVTGEFEGFQLTYYIQ